MRKAAILLSNHRIRKWQSRNPGAPFAKYYADRLERKLLAGKHHTTLGKRGRLAGRGAELEWDRISSARRGLGDWDSIVALGLEPGLRCVDYGCGSLRLGQHAIGFLNAGNYYGIDVTDAFIASGLELIDPTLLLEKAPSFVVIDHDALQAVKLWRPDFIFSNAVLQHVPPEDLGLYFERLDTMMGRDTTAFIFYITSERTEQFETMSWSYPEDVIRAAVHAVAPSLVIERDTAYRGRRSDGRPREVLRLRKGPARKLPLAT